LPRHGTSAAAMAVLRALLSVASGSDGALPRLFVPRAQLGIALRRTCPERAREVLNTALDELHEQCSTSAVFTGVPVFSTSQSDLVLHALLQQAVRYRLYDLRFVRRAGGVTPAPCESS
jgi:hypothetical protein